MSDRSSLSQILSDYTSQFEYMIRSLYQIEYLIYDVYHKSNIRSIIHIPNRLSDRWRLFHIVSIVDVPYPKSNVWSMTLIPNRGTDRWRLSQIKCLIDDPYINRLFDVYRKFFFSARWHLFQIDFLIDCTYHKCLINDPYPKSCVWSMTLIPNQVHGRWHLF